MALFMVGGLVEAAPHLTIKEPVFDFGYVPQNSNISHRFWLYNTGEDTLKIEKVVPGWGCTKAPLAKDVLAVGDSTMLEIIFSTRTYNKRITKRPKIHTNEGTPPKSVQIKSFVMDKPDEVYPLMIDPYKLDISQFGERVRDKIKFTIHNVSQEDLDLKLVVFPDDLATIKLPEKVKANSDAEGEIQLLDSALDQQFSRSFTIEVSDEQSTRFTVPFQRSMRFKGGSNQASKQSGK
jgi:hypothetical protein